MSLNDSFLAQDIRISSPPKLCLVLIDFLLISYMKRIGHQLKDDIFFFVWTPRKKVQLILKFGGANLMTLSLKFCQKIIGSRTRAMPTTSPSGRPGASTRHLAVRWRLSGGPQEPAPSCSYPQLMWVISWLYLLYCNILCVKLSFYQQSCKVKSNKGTWGLQYFAMSNMYITGFVSSVKIENIFENLKTFRKLF